MFIVNDICYASEPSTKIRVKSAKALPGQMLLVTFTSGESRLFDASTLSGSAFQPLKNEKIFSDIQIFHGMPTWMNGEIDIAPETLYAESFPYEAPDAANLAC